MNSSFQQRNGNERQEIRSPVAAAAPTFPMYVGYGGYPVTPSAAMVQYPAPPYPIPQGYTLAPPVSLYQQSTGPGSYNWTNGLHNQSPTNISSISQLNLAMGYCNITGEVIDILQHRNSAFSFIFKDDTSSIKATFFGQACHDKYFNVISQNQFYTVMGGRLMIHSKNFRNHAESELQMIFNDGNVETSSIVLVNRPITNYYRVNDRLENPYRTNPFPTIHGAVTNNNGVLPAYMGVYSGVHSPTDSRSLEENRTHLDRAMTTSNTHNALPASSNSDPSVTMNRPEGIPNMDPELLAIPAKMKEMEQRLKDAQENFNHQISNLTESLKRAESNHSETVNCVICQNDRRVITFSPCHHMCCCETCSSNPRLDKCPLCRADITSKTRTFW